MDPSFSEKYKFNGNMFDQMQSYFTSENNEELIVKLYAIKVKDYGAFDAALMDPKFNVRIDRGEGIIRLR